MLSDAPMTTANTAAASELAAMAWPLSRYLSLTRAPTTWATMAATKGDTLITLASVPPKPMPSARTGRNAGKAFMEVMMQMPKRTISSFFQSLVTSVKSRQVMWPSPLLPEVSRACGASAGDSSPLSSLMRSAACALSSAERNGAVSMLCGTRQNTASPVTTGRMPSTRNTSCHPLITSDLTDSSPYVMAPADAPAAANMHVKNPMRSPRFRRGYTCDMRNSDAGLYPASNTPSRRRRTTSPTLLRMAACAEDMTPQQKSWRAMKRRGPATKARTVLVMWKGT